MSAGLPEKGRHRELAWPILAFVVAYLTILTQDLRLGPVPLKVPLLAIALTAWWLERGRHTRLEDFRWGPAVVAVGLLAPIAWTVVAVVTRTIGSDVAVIAYRDVAEEASRFGYILLYFPLADLLGSGDSQRHRGWLWPILGLAVITWVLWAGVAVFDARYGGRSTVLAFSGIFSEQGGAFRVFVANQILFAPALGFLLARALRVRWSWPAAGGLALLLSASYHAHTRGLWVALLAVGSVVLLLQWRGLMRLLAMHITVWTLPTVLILAGGAASAVLLTGAVDLPGFLGDQSAGLRVSQAGVLFDGWRNQPVLGSGLGAALRGGFVRSTADPWSFELTYLQLLFQMGVCGLLLVLWALTAPFASTVRMLSRRPEEIGRRELSVAGLAALAGVLVASATNPYLLSAFGMLCVALGLALADLGARAPLRPRGSLSTRPPGLPFVAGVTALMIVLTAMEFAGDRV